VIGRQLAAAAVGTGAAVGQAVGPRGVPPPQEGAGPDGRQADLSGGPGRAEGMLRAGQQPDQLPVGLLDAGAAGAIATIDPLGCQVRDDRQPGAGHGGPPGRGETPMISHPCNSV
jgi:hypothetical protein